MTIFTVFVRRKLKYAKMSSRPLLHAEGSVIIRLLGRKSLSRDGIRRDKFGSRYARIVTINKSEVPHREKYSLLAELLPPKALAHSICVL
jgi:hypothetical protein